MISKKRLSHTLINEVTTITQAEPDSVSTQIREATTGDISAPSGSANAATLVKDFLVIMERRGLEAQTYLANNFVMTFPGSGELTSLEQLAEWSKGRYRFVKKTIQAVDVAYRPDGANVTVHGMLHGEWPDGSPFSEVRFIDRFEVRNNQLVRQDVWNDLANAQPR